MKAHRFSVLAVIVLSAVVTACCSNTKDTAEDMSLPGGPAVETAGWESHPAAPWNEGAGTASKPAVTASAKGAEIESLRAMNRRLNEQVTKLMGEVQSMKQPPAPAPAEASAVVAPKGEIELGTVRGAIQKSGAAEMTASLSPEGEVYIVVPGALCFASGRADLQPVAQEKLRKLFQSLKAEFPGLKVRVEGHTDADPIRKSKWESNQALSEARAGAVASFLTTGGGLGAAQVSSVGFGSTKPVASNDTPGGKAENRRVEIYLVP